MGNVLRVAKLAGDDIRLNMKLYKSCATDWKKFCKDVEPGHMRVQVRARKSALCLSVCFPDCREGHYCAPPPAPTCEQDCFEIHMDKSGFSTTCKD
jgi:hypothetical protein